MDAPPPTTMQPAAAPVPVQHVCIAWHGFFDAPPSMGGSDADADAGAVGGSSSSSGGGSTVWRPWVVDPATGAPLLWSSLHRRDARMVELCMHVPDPRLLDRPGGCEALLSGLRALGAAAGGRTDPGVQDVLRALDLHRDGRGYRRRPRPAARPAAPGGSGTGSGSEAPVAWWRVYERSLRREEDPARAAEYARVLARADDAADVEVRVLRDARHPAAGDPGRLAFGLFARRPLTGGAVVALYSRGALVVTEEATHRYLSADVQPLLGYGACVEYLDVNVEPNPLTCPAAMLNDRRGLAPAPSARLQHMVRVCGRRRTLHTFVVVDRDEGVAADAELLLDYGAGYWEVEDRADAERQAAQQRLRAEALRRSAACRLGPQQQPEV